MNYKIKFHDKTTNDVLDSDLLLRDLENWFKITNILNYMVDFSNNDLFQQSLNDYEKLLRELNIPNFIMDRQIDKLKKEYKIAQRKLKLLKR